MCQLPGDKGIWSHFLFLLMTIMCLRTSLTGCSRLPWCSWSPRPERSQSKLSYSLFYWVGPGDNSIKTFAIPCAKCPYTYHCNIHLHYWNPKATINFPLSLWRNTVTWNDTMVSKTSVWFTTSTDKWTHLGKETIINEWRGLNGVHEVKKGSNLEDDRSFLNRR